MPRRYPEISREKVIASCPAQRTHPLRSMPNEDSAMALLRNISRLAASEVRVSS